MKIPNVTLHGQAICMMSGDFQRGSAASKHSTTWPAIALKGRYQASTLFSCLWGSVTDKLISGTLSDVEFKWVSAFLPKAARPVSVLYHLDQALCTAKDGWEQCSKKIMPRQFISMCLGTP
ncbi:hypothetical protein B296_00034883 [Ensete ventricosum]|uniref:Uncharacterized protein n=1 Tax=Ensete ventricosum TaxID=4639 RepID=A0A426Y113_ENSVE|nr:hypothetical protein B296_00034883 [Ensete ventricosum]